MTRSQWDYLLARVDLSVHEGCLRHLPERVQKAICDRYDAGLLRGTESPDAW